MNKRLWRERVKTLLIVLLAFSALYMIGKITEYSDVDLFARQDLAAGEAEAAEDRSGVYLQCARPLVASLTTDSGERCGLRYGSSSVNELYQRYSAALAEALGSAGESVPVSFEEWEQALSGPGVYFDFINALPLRSLAVWLGSDMTGTTAAEHGAARMCLSRQDEETAFYYIREQDGLCYRCDTLTTLSTELSGFAANGALFAFEAGEDYENTDPYSLLVGSLPELYEPTAENPLGAGFSYESLIESFGMNSYVALAYSEADGTNVYVDGDAALRISDSGELSFHQSYGGLMPVSGGETGSAEDVIDAAYRLAESVTAPYRGSCEIMLSSCEYSESTREYTMSFIYVTQGLVVRLPGGVGAAEITVRNGYITDAAFLLRRYGQTEVAAQPLPEKQAFVLAGSHPGEPLLCCLDEGERTHLGWIVFER